MNLARLRLSLASPTRVRGKRGVGVWLLTFFLAAPLVAPLHATPLSVTDDGGTTLSFTQPPQRIISLAPNLTELAYAAGAGSHLIAVTAYSDYPPEATQLPQVGDAFRLDWERLIAFKPDLVLGWQSGLSARDRALFGKLGIKLLVLEPRRLDDIPKALRLLGQVAGTSITAEIAAHNFEQQRETLRQRYAHPPLIRAYFQIADTTLLTVNGSHIISDVLSLCGGENVFASTPVLTPTVSGEALLAARPDILLALAATPAQGEEVRRFWRQVTAMSPLQVGFVHPDLMSRAAPRLMLGAAHVCKQLAEVRRKRSAASAARKCPSVLLTQAVISGP